jgi:hypothetical protein
VGIPQRYSIKAGRLTDEERKKEEGGVKRAIKGVDMTKVYYTCI